MISDLFLLYDLFENSDQVEIIDDQANDCNGDIDELYKEDALVAWIDHISRIKLLTVDEEIALSKKKDKGDKQALCQLIEANYRLVFSVAKKYRAKSSLSLADIVQEGNIGLFRAAELFDWRKIQNHMYQALPHCFRRKC